MASRNCCKVQAAVGWTVTLQCRMRRTSHFHHHEHVQHSEASRDGYQEVSGHDGLRVVADKRPPLLRACSPTASRITIVRPIRTHRSWRNQDPELHRQFRCDALFAPGRVLLTVVLENVIGGEELANQRHLYQSLVGVLGGQGHVTLLLER